MTTGPTVGSPEVRCIGEAVSWLRLEQHRLGELSAADATAVEAHLAACPTCAACAAQARQPLTLSLPDVVVTGKVLTGAPRPRSAWWFRGWRGRASAGAVSAAAVAVTLALVMRSTGPGSENGPVASSARDTLAGSKGGEVALELVRERGSVIDHGAHAFLATDRWKVLITCPAERVLFWDVVVEDGGQASFPLSPAAPLACGNHVALPGAFRLSGVEAKRLCVVLSDDPVDRRRFAPGGPIDRDPDADGARQLCVTLRPEEGSAADGADADIDPERR